MATRPIRSALVSVFSKAGLEPIIRELAKQNVQLYSTGGTQRFIEELGVAVEAVENITSYPSILDGRVKTLHPKVFGGLLARREEGHLAQLAEYDIPEIDLVIVDLYPFEETVASTDDEAQIIEKIDIGGISLIRAAAKNYRDVAVISSRDQYDHFLQLLQNDGGQTTLEARKELATAAFAVSSRYDTQIHHYFLHGKAADTTTTALRYGENPHQRAWFHGDLGAQFEQLSGKALSYNNLVDIDAAVGIMAELAEGRPAFAILKHTNACGVAVRNTGLEAWHAALAADNVSAFGGILITNTEVDLATAEQINQLFYEVLIAPSFSREALDLLTQKKKRVLLRIAHFQLADKLSKSLLNGTIEQEADQRTESATDFTIVTQKQPTEAQLRDLVFAAKVGKHLKSNTIVLARDEQLLGMGCGQTSRVDACRQAIEKARKFGFDLAGAVLASDAFFPFPDCIELAAEAGIAAVVQPGGSIKDHLSVEAADKHGLTMVTTGVRHFKH